MKYISVQFVFDNVVYILDVVVYIFDVVVYIPDIVENKLHLHLYTPACLTKSNFPANNTFDRTMAQQGNRMQVNFSFRVKKIE